MVAFTCLQTASGSMTQTAMRQPRMPSGKQSAGVAAGVAATFPGLIPPDIPLPDYSPLSYVV